ncbi:InlB B-repeat-containing protein [Fibrobacter sp. UBA2449]|uniref:InlB B-repeat-containing protein n=1 Tax=Fibrobacter sp. UBA2449 TaxID=1946529 RepID=UPI0025C1D5F5|nr:T9SS type A sorting domain-containing protein [Fibrobacter sp. UBA2449]
MKTKIHAFFLCALTVLFAVAASWADDVSLTSDGNGGFYVNLPVTGTNQLTITDADITNGLTSFKVYDDGGVGGEYSSNASGALQVTAPAGYVFQVTGSSYTESSWDYFRVYDGASNGEILYENAGLDQEIDFTGSRGSITFSITSDGSVTRDGVNLTVTLVEDNTQYSITLNQSEGGTVTSDVESAIVGTEVTVNLNVDAGYSVANIVIEDADGGAIEYIDGIAGNEITVTFVMPAKNVSITPTFVTPRPVSIATVSMGSMESDVTEAILGTTVTLTAIPEEGALFRGVTVVGDDDGLAITTNVNGNTATFVMPNQPVTITPKFANPNVITFDENGCLSNGTYFHLECNGNVCEISQGVQENPNEGEADFRCWYLGTAWDDGEEVCEWDEEEETEVCEMVEPEKGVVDILEENGGAAGFTLKLGGPLNFGGYDAANSKCVMPNFHPIAFAESEGVFDGQNNTISGLCYENAGGLESAFGFLQNVKTVSNVTFDNARVVVNNVEQGSVAGIVTGEVSQSDASFTNVHVTNSYVAGTQVGAFAGTYTPYNGTLSISNSSVVDTKVYGLNVAAMQGVGVSAAGGFLGYTNGNGINMLFSNDTVRATSAGATVIADDASYTGTGVSYRGGFVGYVYFAYDVWAENCPNAGVNQSLVSGIVVSGAGESNVGGIAGGLPGAGVSNTKLENMTVTGNIAGGAIGYMRDGAYGTLSATNDTLAGANAITGASAAGGILGVGNFVAGNTQRVLLNSFEYINVSANVAGGKQVGGIAGSISNNSYVAMSATNVTMSGYIGATVDIMNGNVEIGGLFGHVEGGNSLTISGNAIESDFTFTNMGASSQGTLYMGPIFGYNSVENFTVYGNYSNGGISYTGIDAANANVGYIGGYADLTGETAIIVGNYHYGTDAVASGLGNISAADWKTDNGDYVFLANVRNASDGLTDDGAVGFYYYEVSGGPSGASYMDLFAADLSSGTFSRVANGIASETEMKSPMFAAAMNYVQDMNGGAPTWTQTDGNLPAIATPLEKPNYLLPFAIMDAAAGASLSQEQKNVMGLKSILTDVNVGENPPVVSTQLEGLTGYTDADGRANRAFVDSVSAVLDALSENGYVPYLEGEGLASPFQLTANTIFTDAVETILLQTRQSRTFDVVYQYCVVGETTVCNDLDDVPDISFVFVSPKINQVDNSEESYTALLPHVFALADVGPLSMSVSFQDASGGNVEVSGFNGDFSKFVSFYDVIANVFDNADVEKIVLSYQSGGAIPSFDIENPTMSDLNVDVYGLNASGEKTLITSVAVPEQNAVAPYGSSFVPRFGDKVGYAIESYTVSFTVTNPGEDRCDVIEPLPVVESESKSVAPWEELVVEQSPCKSKTWTVAGLTPGEDEVDLTNVKIAKARNESESFWKESFSIVPNYVAKPYNIVFHFNLTDNHFELDDDIYTLFKTGYNNPENTLDLEENSAFPLFYGVDDGFDYINIAGWTLDESKANCVMDEEGCFTSSQINNGSVAFTSLTANLITAAADAGLLVTNPENPGNPQTMQLYPVWEKQRNTWMANAVVIGSCEQHGAKCYEYPINFTLSQDFSLNGNPVRIQVPSGEVVVEANPTKYGRGVRYYNYANNVYPFDFTYEVTPGFKVTSVTPPMYNEETSKLEITGSDNPAVLVDFSVLSYNVKFNLDAIGNDVYLGRGVRSSGVMSYEDGKYMFPPVYSRPTYGDDFEMNDYYRTNVFYGKHNWSVKNGDAYEGGSRDFDSKLVGLFEGNEHYVPAANEDENASITLYANYVEPMPMSGSSNYTEVADEIHVCALDEENACIYGDGSEYHGSVVLSQSYDNDAENVHWSFEHASEPVVQRAEDYETEENFVRHIIYVPSQDDTLTFDVSVRPDPGYTMAISDFTFSRNFNGIPQTNAEPVNWNYVAADATSGTLNIQPHAMGSMIFKVRYTQLAYNVAFLRPDPDLGLFVGNKSADGNYQMDWLESADGVTAETVHAPAVYDGNGCRIAWKVAGREVESRTNTDVVNELPFMAVIGNDAGNPVVNTLELDAEHVVANECSGSYQLMLDVEGEGDVYFIQKIGAEPVEDSDPEQTIVKHVFVRAGDEAPMTLSIPKVFDKNGTEAGVKLTVVAVPAEGYVLNTLSYDVMFNGNSVTVLAQDSTELNIMEPQAWHVKFEQYKPVYVTYDLSLGEEDSSNVWIPADAVASGSLQIGADGSDAPMWIPFRTDKCFAGWSTNDPNGAQPDVNVLFKEVSVSNLDLFSHDAAAPTKLYASWVDYTGYCSWPRNTLASINLLRYYEDINDEESYRNMYEDTLLVIQRFANVEFKHKAWMSPEFTELTSGPYSSDPLKFVYNPSGYEMSFEILPGLGKKVDPDDPAAKLVVSFPEDIALVEGENGWFTVPANEDSHFYFVGYKEIFDDYDFVLSPNAGEGEVVYGENWSKNATIRIDGELPAGNVFRTDACFAGWAYEPEAPLADAIFDKPLDVRYANTELLTKRNERLASGLNVDTLYAMWDASQPGCRSGILYLDLDAAILDLATVSFFQNVDGVETKVLEVGSDGASIPFGAKRSSGNITNYIGDNIYFTRVEVTPKPGVTLAQNYTVSYVNESDADAEEHALPTVAGGAETLFDDNIIISVTGLSRNDYTVAYHENAGDVPVFYGEHWAASATYGVGDTLSESVYRTDKCLAGWTFDVNSADGLVYRTLDADFIGELEMREIDGDIDLYAVWSDDNAACESPIQNVTVTLSDELQGKATVELLQDVEGETRVAAVVGDEGVSIPKVTTRAVDINGNTEYLGEFVYFSGLRVVPATGYALDNTVNPSYKVGDEAEVEMTAEPQPWYMTEDAVVSAAVNAVSYELALDENANGANVFYMGEPLTSVSVKVSDDEAARTLPANLYRADACFVGWSFSETATTGFTMFDADVALAYEDAGTSTLYAVWDANCQQTVYTVTSADKGKGVLTLAQGTRAFEVGDGLSVPAVGDGLEFVASFAPATGYAYDADANLAVLDANGVSLGELEDGALMVNQTVSIKALGLAESEYTITFNVNAGGAPVYYGTPADGAAPAYTYKVAEPKAFPTDFYRTDACLTGWRATEAPVEGETLFHEFDAAFVEAVAEIPSYTGTLYAVWGTCATTNNVTVAQYAPEMGSLSLVQRDADGEIVNSTEITDEAVTLPLGKGDVAFTVEFVANPGYSMVANSYFYTVDANGNSLAALVNNRLTLAGNTVVKAPAKLSTYEIAFDVNVESPEKFFGSSWRSSGKFDVTQGEDARAFPMQVYRVGYKLVGWSIEKTDNADVYTAFDEELAKDLSATQRTTLYGVWVTDDNQETYTVSLYNANAGKVSVSQSADGIQTNFEIGNDGLVVPAVSEGLLFNTGVTLNSGYFANGSSLYVVDAEGTRLESLVNGVLNVNADKILEIPVESDGAQFVFVENTRARVFYENGWNNKGFFALDGETDFPRGLLRTDAELLGWAFSRNGSKYYERYDEDFVADLRNARTLGMPVDTLYAVWDEYATVDKELVKSEGDRTGSFFISQTVNDMMTDPIEVTAAGIEIPRSEKGITFNVTYEVIPGYRIDSESAITKSDATGEVLGSTANGGSLVMGQEQSLSLGASVAAIPYRFTYDVNGGDANVFYGDGWFSSDEKTLDDESVALPNNIYRADAKLVGWSFDSDASEGSFDLTSDLVRDVSVSNEVRTLYAVWEPAEVETYTVSFANTNVGSLVLTQDVEDTTVSFTVADSGLVVPVVQGGLKFKAAYTLKAGFSGSTDSLYVVDDISGLLTSLADGELTVAEDVTLAIPTEGETFDVVFHANRDKDVLFYGSDWKNSASYKLDDSTVSIPLPAYLYTASACMVGWSLDSKGEGEAYTEFSSELADALLSLEKTDAYDLYAVWGFGEACDDMYNRVALQSANGTVKLVEIAEQREIEHEFAKDNTIILPKTVNGNMLRVESVPDSSFVLDSLVMVRLGGDERLATFEGGVLPFNLAEASLVAYFGKANRTDIEFVKPVVTQAGNAVQFAFATSEFEVTRKVSARVILETEAGESVADTVIADSIVPPYSGVWQMFPLSADKYVLTALLYDSKDTVETSERFEVKAEIAAVAEDGWQMISLVNLDRDAMKWDDDDAKFYWWDESSAMGDFWQYREYSPEDEIEPTRGYWYSSLEGRPLVLKPATDESVMDNVVWNLDSINSGWNLVANPYGFNLNVYGDRPNENLDAAEKSEVNFWRWNPDAGRYEPAVVIKPYEAVWAEVHHSMEWVLPVKPDFTSRDTSGLDSLESPLSKRFLAKATSNRDWRLQAILSDKKGKVDSWNILGASTRPFVAKEPPAGMGDHVNLSIVDGERMLATSVRAPADELEWSVELSATSDRMGELSFKGVESLREVGLKVFVTVDGKTTEMHGGETLRVELGAFAKKATVRVAPAAKVVASFSIDALRYVKSGANVGVTFEASDGLAGSRTVVDILDMGGKVVSSRSATTLAGVNQLVLDAPKPGLYMLRVRAGSQMKAGRIMVK